MTDQHAVSDDAGARRGTTPAAEVVQGRLVSQVREVRRLDPLVRRDEPDAVHQMRVAIRRLRSALATFRPMLDREVTEPVREELKWLAGALGEARDTEVMHDRLRSLILAEPREAVRGETQSRVDRELDEQYQAARGLAMSAMQSPRYAALLDRLDALAASPPWTAAAAEDADTVLRDRARHDWKRLKRRHTAALEAEDPAERALRLHETRKAAKRARYAAEVAVPVHGKDAERFVEETKRLQTVLGDHHDAVVTQALLRDLADRADAEGDSSFTFGVLHVREEHATRKAEARLEKAWRRASRKKRRRWLS